MIGARVKAEREQRGWTQRDLAAHSGVNQSYISQLERGERKRAGAEILQRIAHAFDLTIDGLMNEVVSEDLPFPTATLLAEGLPEQEAERIALLWEQHPEKRKALLESAHKLAQVHAKLDRLTAELQ